MDDDFDLALAYARILRRWPWVSLAAVAGGILGLLASFAQAPRYRSSAVIEIAVDYNRTAPAREVTVEQAFDRVRSLLLADETLEGAIRLSGAAGIDVPEVRSRIRLAHRPNGWELIVDGQDPAQAAALAEAWANVAMARLEEAMGHALRAAELQWALYQASCQLVADEAARQALWVCQSDVVEGDPATLAASLLAEASLSHGILPVFTYSVAQHAAVPRSPMVWDRGWLILAGAMAGMISGFTGAAFDPRISPTGRLPVEARPRADRDRRGRTPRRR